MLEYFRNGVIGGLDEVLQNSFHSEYALVATEVCELVRIQGQMNLIALWLFFTIHIHFSCRSKYFNLSNIFP